MFGGNTRNVWVLIMLMLAGVVVGGFIGEYVGRLPYMSWLTYGPGDFGLTSPVSLDFGLIVILFGFTIKFTICGIIGVALAIFVYRKWL